MSELDQYFDAYAEQTLDSHGKAAFCDWLHESDAHVDEFARDAYLHWQLLAIGQRRGLQADIAEAPAKAERYRLRRVVSDASSLGGRVRRRWAPSWRTAAGLAAALALAATVVMWAILDRSRPTMVAQVTKTAPGVAWSGGSKYTAGAFVPAGRSLAIDRGRLLTTLASGVQIVLEGPAELRLVSPSRVFLSTGRMSVTVPRQAMGFVADSPVGEFIDLGTEYTLKLQSGGDYELHVFSGLVEVRPHEGAQAPPLTIPEGRGLRYDADADTTTPLPYRPAEQMSL
jgi:ferric-dicitrate binding protein FerR (iron transport regulator)